MGTIKDIEQSLRKVIFDGSRVSIESFVIAEDPKGKLPKEGRQNITAEYARQLLTRVRQNRSLRPSLLKFLVIEIMEGRWRYNGQTIGFKKNGELNDGQHRLWACILADKPIDIGVAINVPDNAFLVTDTGRPRQAKDLLSMLGHQSTTSLAAAARWGLLYDHARLSYRTGKQISFTMSPEVIINYIEQHPEFDQAAKIYYTTRKLDKLLPPSAGIFLIYKMRQADPAAAQSFITKMQTGAGLRPGEPVLTLRERLLEERSQTTRKLNYQILLAFAIKAWNAEQRGEAMARLTFRLIDHFPRFLHDEPHSVTSGPTAPAQAAQNKDYAMHILHRRKQRKEITI